jgi:hypothetical protein
MSDKEVMRQMELAKRGKNKPVVRQGHQGNSNLPVIREPQDHRPPILDQLQPGTRYYKMGRVAIFISPPVESARMGWHMSISHPERYPSWDEVAKAWYELVPDADNRVGTMILPKRKDYISIHNYCFQVHEELKS